jgi:hypothetical protein
MGTGPSYAVNIIDLRSAYPLTRATSCRTPSRLPDPDHLTVPDRPGVVEAASRPPLHLQGQTASSFTGLLRQTEEAGLAPASGHMAPRGAP